ncbi:MAG TPA: M15 family metallopeptidase [Parcubacteria group bacterium]|jgi:LAS superfamily LD-carboxypeptidase LdcB|nr:M15 family metallopeptidase [Parcubacteria group bacterium]
MKINEGSNKEKALKIVPSILIVSSIAFNVYLYNELRLENLSIKSEIETFETALSITQKRLSSTTAEKLAVVDSLQKEKENTNFFQSQIQNLAGTVGVLEKLSKTDAELLKKYSKVYFLNENYIPESISPIDPKYLLQKDKVTEINTKVLPYLQKLIDDANNSGLNLLILSGYRSFHTQASLKSAYKVTYGSGANKFSADQGYSEHQLGTTVDFTNNKIGAVLSGFDKTEEYKWLQENAHKYGFILSYPKNNTYYIFEPWHWRYVGVELATKLYDEKLDFYSMDQRTLDSYLLNLFN